LGVIHQQQGDIEAATAEFKRTLYVDRDFVLAHFALANILRQQGQVHEACREYENTLRALYAKPEGAWTRFLGGFRPDLLARTCERSLLECGRGN
ncbi:MAG: tetratricopeptide repeat protein, partial [Actinobacteria bacterium]